MESKRCTKCGEVKEFNLKDKRTEVLGWCKDCFKKYDKEYIKHKKEHRLKDFVFEYYNGWKCGCGVCEEVQKIRYEHKQNGIPKFIDGHTHKSVEARQKISIRMSGDNNPFANKHHTEETIQLLSFLATGNKWCVGRKMSTETIDKIRKKKDKREPLECIVCGTVIQTKRSRIKEGQKCCSYVCQRIYQTGKNNPSYIDGQSPLKTKIHKHKEYKIWMQHVLKKDGSRCVKCGNDDISDFEIHHIKWFSIILRDNKITTVAQALECNDLWDINNGMTLCKKCHRLEHKIIRLEKKRKAMEVNERHEETKAVIVTSGQQESIVTEAIE